MTQPLQGIRVLDLSRLLPGPYLSMVLADMGADVVKVEAPAPGDYMRSIPPMKGKMSGRYLAVNRNKKSLVLNLKSSVHRDAFLRMVAQADVVIESFRPGVMDKLGIGFEELREHNAKIILCSISGYGQNGPYRERAGHDLNYIALSGVLAMTGYAQSPVPPGAQIADLAGGALWSATAILGALVGRERLGAQHLDVSMTEGALALMAAELGNLDCGKRPTRASEELNGGLACYSVYRCKDDRFVAVGALEPKFWMAFNQAIGREGNAAEVMGPAEKQEALRGEISEILAGKTRDEWAQIFSKFDCCCEPVLELEELAEHPLHKERGVFFHIDSSDGRVLQVHNPVSRDSEVRHPPPRQGQQSKEVLEEFGFSPAEISDLV